jgi:hypothetical protein
MTSNQALIYLVFSAIGGLGIPPWTNPGTWTLR